MKLLMSNSLHLKICSAADIVTARQQGRILAMQLGFGGSDLTVIATAISELTRHIVNHASRGEVTLSELHQGGKHGICVVAHEESSSRIERGPASHRASSAHNGSEPDFADAAWPMEFEVRADRSKGTTVTMKKWLR